MTTRVITLKKRLISAFPLRTTKGETQTFTAETDGLVINKRGYSLMGVSWPATGVGVLLTVKVGLTIATCTRVHASISIDVETENSISISDLAEWPCVQLIFSANITGDVEIAFA